MSFRFQSCVCSLYIYVLADTVTSIKMYIVYLCSHYIVYLCFSRHSYKYKNVYYLLMFSLYYHHYDCFDW